MPLRRTALALLALLVLLSAAAGAQSMAHPGWRGNGIASEAWWRHTTFLRCDHVGTFQQALGMLDTAVAIGADTLILPDLLPPAATSTTPPRTAPFLATFGTEEDLDALLREASARRLHVIVRLPLSRLAEGMGEARFWLSRGISGFDVGDVRPSDVASLRALASLQEGFPGSRVLLAHPVADARLSGAGGRNTVVIPTQTADEVEAQSGVPMSSGAAPQAVEIASGAAGNAVSLPQLLPLLLTNSLIIVDQDVAASDTGRDLLHRVLSLRSSNAVLRNARSTPLNVTGLRGWTLHDARGPQSLLLLWNASSVDAPLELALLSAGIRAAYLTPILRSDGRAGPLTIATDKLPAGTAVLGSLYGTSSLARRGKR